MELRPDILLFGIVVAIAFVILGLVSVIRQATRNSSAHQRWLRGNYACFYDLYEEALEHYDEAAARLDEAHEYADAHRLAIAYGKAATYFMMRRYEEAVDHYQQAVALLPTEAVWEWLAAAESPPEPVLGADTMWWGPLDHIESYVSSLGRTVIACRQLGRADQAKSSMDAIRQLASKCGSHFRIDVAHVLHQEAVQLQIQYGAVEVAIELKEVVYNLLCDDPMWPTGELGELQLGLAESNSNCGDLARSHEIVSLMLECALPSPLEDFATVLAGNLSCLAGELTAAINLYEQAIRLRTAMYGRDSSAAAICLIVLSDVLRVHGDYPGARETLATIAPQFLSPDGEHRMSACRVRAVLAAHEGDFDVVEEMFDVLMRDASIADSPVVLAETHLLEAYSWMTLDNDQFALQSAKAALEIAESVYSDDNPLMCQYLTVRALLSVSVDTHAAQQWLARGKQAIGNQTHFFKLQYLHLLQTDAELSLALGAVEPAERHLETLAAEVQRIFLPDSITHSELQCQRGELCLATGRPEEAVSWLQQSLECRARAGQPPTHPSLRRAWKKLSEALRAVSDADGVTQCEQALEAIAAARQRPDLQATDNPYQA